MVGFLGKVANQLDRYLGVRIGVKGNAQLNQLATELVRVNQRAVMGKRDNDVANGGEVGLRGFPALGTGGTVANVANGKLAGKRVDIGVGEHMAHQA